MKKSLPLFDQNKPQTVLSVLENRQDLAELLEVSEKGLRHILYIVPYETKYKDFEIPKRSGGFRKISAPNDQLKELQRRLGKVLTSVYQPRAAVHGFTTHKSIVSNASYHIKRRYVFNIDLEDFFPSIHLGRIIGMFKKKPYLCSDKIAVMLAQICCAGETGILPQGAPTSPIISNMLCAKLDGELSRFAKRLGWTYTRYADDLTFSTNKSRISEEIAVPAVDRGKDFWILGNTLMQIIEQNSFRANSQKIRMQFNKTQRQEVTGIIVNQSLNVRRSYIRDVRAMLYNWETKGLPSCEKKYLNTVGARRQVGFKFPDTFSQILKGKIDHIGNVRGKDDKIYLQFLKQIAHLAPKLLSARQHELLRSQNILKKLWYVEVEYQDGSDTATGTAFFLKDYGLITCAHVIAKSPEKLPEVLSIRVMTRDLKQTFTAYPTPKVINYELDLAILDVKCDDPHFFESEEINFTDDAAGYPIKVAGFPNHSPTKSGVVITGEITGTSVHFGNEYFLVSAPIVEGNSGGPVFNNKGNVIGVAARGGESDDQANETDFKGVIPIGNLKFL